jgi:hypothetical protein
MRLMSGPDTVTLKDSSVSTIVSSMIMTASQINIFRLSALEIFWLGGSNVKSTDPESGKIKYCMPQLHETPLLADPRRDMVRIIEQNIEYTAKYAVGGLHLLRWVNAILLAWAHPMHSISPHFSRCCSLTGCCCTLFLSH